MISQNLTWTEKEITSKRQHYKELWKHIEKYTGNPMLVQFIAGIIKIKNVPERDEKALAEAVLGYAQNHIKFFNERPERFVSPLKTIAWGIGDCDDKSIFIACSLRSFKIPICLNAIEFYSPVKDMLVSHVYPLAFVNREWEALESVHKWPIGRDPAVLAQEKGYKVTINTFGDKANA